MEEMRNNTNSNQETYRELFFGGGGLDCQVGRSELAHEWGVIATLHAVINLRVSWKQNFLTTCPITSLRKTTVLRAKICGVRGDQNVAEAW
jgi:hypothetical protein